MGKASEAILALRPVSFRYKKEIDPRGTPEFGLVAEEVEKVNPDLIIRDLEGKPYTVRYEEINAMLLNEFLKEHGKVGKLEAAVTQQQKEFQSIVAQQQRGSSRRPRHGRRRRFKCSRQAWPNRRNRSER